LNKIVIILSLRINLTFFLCELVKQAGLAHAHVSDDDVFKDVGVVVRARRHLFTQNYIH